jgi:hypothetical protein
MAEVVRPLPQQVIDPCVRPEEPPDVLSKTVEVLTKIWRSTLSSTVKSKQPSPEHRTRQTVPVSIDGHRTLALGRACYALPTMLIPQDRIDSYNSTVRDRLIDELQQRLRSVRCRQPELLMVADASGKVGPCVVLSIWDDTACETADGRNKAVRRATKMVGRLQSVKDCPFPVKVIADKISLAARLLAESERFFISTVNAARGARRTFVSTPITVQAQEARSFRLGGLIRAGSKIYGLTVAHPFSSLLEIDDATPADQPELSAPTESDDSDTDDLDGFDNDSEEMLFQPRHWTTPVGATVISEPPERDAVTTKTSRPAPQISPSTENEAGISIGLSHPQRSIVSSIGKIVAVGGQLQNGRFRAGGDWALLELSEDFRPAVNTYQSAPDAEAVCISGIHSGRSAPGTQVLIMIEPDKPLEGVIGQRDVPLTVEGWEFAATQVLLNTPLGQLPAKTKSRFSYLQHSSSGTLRLLGCQGQSARGLPGCGTGSPAYLLYDIGRRGTG